jgi:PAS domain S-box-containing protein
MLRTFRSRLLLAVLLIFGVMLALLQWSAQHQLEQALERSLEQQGQLSAPLVKAAVAPLLAARDLATLRELVTLSVGADGVTGMQVLDHRGDVVASAGELGRAEEQLVLPVELAGQRYGVVRLRLHDEIVTQARQRLLRDALVIGAGVLLGGFVLLVLALQVLGRGQERLVQASRRIAAGELAVAVPDDPGEVREVRDVAAAFNRMAQAVAGQVQALRDGEQRLRTVMGVMTEGLLVNAADGRVTECNDSAARLLGVAREELLTATVYASKSRLMRADGTALPAEEHPVVRTIASGMPQRRLLLQVVHGDGTRLWLQVDSEPVRGEDGAVQAVVSTLTDVTAHVQAEAALRDANQTLEQRVEERTAQLQRALDLAEQASRAKSEFLSRMSHELRTPLNAILGFAQLLALPGAALGEAQRRQLQQIEDAGWHLLELIEEVLDLARIEAGKLAVSLEPVQLGDVARRALEMVTPAAQQQAVALQPLPPEAAALWVHADRKRLLQVLGNLLSNAVKYNRAGGVVTLSAHVTGGQVALTVADTGRGLTPAQLERLFEPFERLGADADGSSGTGIGLVITRRLVELMGGSLVVESVAGEGSRFTVWLAASGAAAVPAMAVAGPDAAPEPRPPPGAAAPPARDAVLAPTAHPGSAASLRRIVYVEDNPSNVELLAAVLQARPQLVLEVAADGLSGLALLQRAPPALAVIDIDLPGLDGRALCRRLRAEPATARLPLLALTAQAMPHDLHATRAAGFDAVLTKPLEVPRFLAELDRLLQEDPR